MNQPVQIIAIIPARGGSKGIPNKNIIDFCGKPLLAWSILQAKSAKQVMAVYVTSDSDDILSVATQYGALPIKRPAELSTDEASSEAALLHAVDYVTATTGSVLEYVVFLQATSPLREFDDIDNALDVIRQERADSLFSAAILDDFCAWEKDENGLRSMTFDVKNRGRRQDRKPLYLENGSIYVFKPGVLKEFDNRMGGKIAMSFMPYWKSFEIDDQEGLQMVSTFFSTRLLHNWHDNSAPPFDVSDLDLIVYDFDGVMTDNRVHVFQDGSECVAANRADGLGVGLIRKVGIPQLILSTETNPVVKARASKLNLEVVDSCDDKEQFLTSYCQKNGYDLDRVLYVGNDINDLKIMKLVGHPVAPADAHSDVKKIAKFITKAVGGAGVVRELADVLLTQRGRENG